jgi:hypothetical protein
MDRLNIDGHRLTRNGQDVILRGVAMGDPMLARQDRPLSDYRFLVEEWGVNTVRISVHPGLWRREPEAVLRALKAEIGAARQQSALVIVDWHAIGWPGQSAFVPPPEWNLPSNIYDCDLALAREFWLQISLEFGRDEGVVFELWNEPVRLPVAVGTRWARGEDWRELRPIYEELVRELRAHAPNLVLLSGGHWASDLTGIAEQPLSDPRTAYSWHVYPGTAGGDKAKMEVLLDGLSKVRPVVVTEWGFGGGEPHLIGDAQGFGETFARDFLARHKLHWTAWCWHPSWQPSLITEDWRTPTPFGRYVQHLLHSTPKGTSSSK